MKTKSGYVRKSTPRKNIKVNGRAGSVSLTAMNTKRILAVLIVGIMVVSASAMLLGSNNTVSSTNVQLDKWKDDGNQQVIRYHQYLPSAATQYNESDQTLDVYYQGIASTEYNPEVWSGTIPDYARDGPYTNWSGPTGSASITDKTLVTTKISMKEKLWLTCENGTLYLNNGFNGKKLDISPTVDGSAPMKGISGTKTVFKIEVDNDDGYNSNSDYVFHFVADNGSGPYKFKLLVKYDKNEKTVIGSISTDTSSNGFTTITSSPQYIDFEFTTTTKTGTSLMPQLVFGGWTNNSSYDMASYPAGIIYPGDVVPKTNGYSDLYALWIYPDLFWRCDSFTEGNVDISTGVMNITASAYAAGYKDISSLDSVTSTEAYHYDGGAYISGSSTNGMFSTIYRITKNITVSSNEKTLPSGTYRSSDLADTSSITIDAKIKCGGDVILDNVKFLVKNSIGNRVAHSDMRSINANFHRLIIGTGVTTHNISEQNNLTQAPLILGGQNWTADASLIERGKTILSADTDDHYFKNGSDQVTADIATFVIIHSGTYSHISAGGTAEPKKSWDLGDSDHLRSTYLVIKKATVMGVVGGAGGTVNVYGGAGTSIYDGGSFIYAYDLDMAGDSYEDKATGHDRPSYQQITATVSFESFGGSGGSMSPVVVPINSKYVVPQCSFTAPTGYYFIGWTNEISNNNYLPGSEIVVSQDMTLQAHWELISNCATVTFKHLTLDRTGETNIQIQVTKGIPYVLPFCIYEANTTEVSTWRAAKWMSESDNSIKYASSGNTRASFAEDVTLVPDYNTGDYTIVLDSNNTSNQVCMNKITAGTEYKLPSSPFSYANHYFIGWSVDGTLRCPGDKYKFTIETDNAGQIISDRKTIYAVWTTDATKYWNLDENSIMQGGSQSGTIHGATHLFVSGKSSVFVVQGGGRDAASVCNVTYLEISGRAEVRHVACGTVTDGSNSTTNYNCTNSANIVVTGKPHIATLLGAGFDTWFINTGSSMSNGTISIKIKGGTIGYVYGGGMRGSVGTSSTDVDISIDMTGGTIEKDLFGGGKGTLDKIHHLPEAITIGGDTKPAGSPGRYDSTNNMGNGNTTGYSKVYGDITINISGGTVNGSIYGGGESAPALSNSNFLGQSVSGATEYSKSIVSPVDLVSSVTGDITINIGGNANVGNVYGGGKGIKLESDLKTPVLEYVNIPSSAEMFGNLTSIPYYSSIFIYADGAFKYIPWLLPTSMSTLNSNVDGDGKGSVTYNNTYSGGDSETTDKKGYNRYAKVFGTTAVNVEGTPTITGNIYGGGSMGIVQNVPADKTQGATYVNVNLDDPSAYIDGDILGGGLGTADRTSVYGTTNVIIRSGTVKSPHSVYGGSENGIVNGDTRVLVINNGKVEQDVFAGGLGVQGYQSIEGSRQIYVSGSGVNIGGSVYGGSKQGDDGNSSFVNLTESQVINNYYQYSNSLVVVEEGRVSQDVFGGGFLGNTYGSTAVYIGYGLDQYGNVQKSSDNSKRVIIDSVFAGANVDVESRQHPFETSLVWGLGMVSVYGNASDGKVTIYGSIMGSGNACNTRYSTSIDLDKFLDGRPMTGIHRATSVTISQSILKITGRSPLTETLGQLKNMSLFYIDTLTLKEDTSISFDAPVDDIGVLCSLNKDGTATSATSPSNKLVFSTGSTFYIRDIDHQHSTFNWGTVKGNFVINTSGSGYGAYVLGSNSSTGGFVTTAEGSYKPCNTSDESGVRCWYISGIQKKIATVNMTYNDLENKFDIAESHVELVKLQSNTTMKYTGGSFTPYSQDKYGRDYEFKAPTADLANGTGSSQPNQLGFMFGYVDNNNKESTIYADTARSVLGSSIQCTYFSYDQPQAGEGPLSPLDLKTKKVQGGNFVDDQTLIGPLRLNMKLVGQPDNTTAYVGYLLLTFQELSTVEYESGGETTTQTMIMSVTEVRIDVYIYGSNEGTETEGYNITMKTDVTGSGDNARYSGETLILIPPTYEMARLTLNSVETHGITAGKMYAMATSNSDNTSGWSNINRQIEIDITGDNTYVPTDTFVGTLLGTTIATIKYTGSGLAFSNIDEAYVKYVFYRQVDNEEPTISVITVKFQTLKPYKVIFRDHLIESEIWLTEGTTLTQDLCKEPSGLNFNGWYLDPEYTNRYNYNIEIHENLKLYGRYSFVVTFDHMDGTKTEMYVAESHSGATLDPSVITAVNPGYDLYGWYKDPELIYKWNKDKDKITDNTTLYAKWIGKEYRIHFIYKDKLVSNEYRLFAPGYDAIYSSGGRFTAAQLDKSYSIGTSDLTINFGDRFGIIDYVHTYIDAESVQHTNLDILDYASKSISGQTTGNVVKWEIVSGGRFINIFNDTVLNSDIATYINKDQAPANDDPSINRIFLIAASSDVAITIEMVADAVDEEQIAEAVESGTIDQFEEARKDASISIQSPTSLVAYPIGPTIPITNNNGTLKEFDDPHGFKYYLFEDEYGEEYIQHKDWRGNRPNEYFANFLNTEPVYDPVHLCYIYDTIKYIDNGGWFTCKDARIIEVSWRGNSGVSTVFFELDFNNEDSDPYTWDLTAMVDRYMTPGQIGKTFVILNGANGTKTTYLVEWNNVGNRTLKCYYSANADTNIWEGRSTSSLGQYSDTATNVVGEYYVEPLSSDQSPSSVKEWDVNPYFTFKYKLNNATRNGYVLSGWHNTKIAEGTATATHPSAGLVRTLKVYYEKESTTYYATKEILYTIDKTTNLPISILLATYTNEDDRPILNGTDETRMLTEEYRTRWNPIDYSVSFTQAGHGIIDAFLIENKNGNDVRTKIADADWATMSFRYGDRIELSYTPSNEKYQLGSWAPTGEYEIESVTSDVTTLVVRGNCGIAASEIKDRVVEILIVYDAGALNPTDKQYTKAILHDTVTGDRYPMSNVPSLAVGELYRAIVPFSDNYELLLQYGWDVTTNQPIHESFADGPDEYRMVGTIKVDKDINQSFRFEVISARFVQSANINSLSVKNINDTAPQGITITSNDLKTGGSGHEYELTIPEGWGFETDNNGNHHYEDHPVRLLDDEGNVIVKLTKYVGILYEDLMRENSNNGYVNNPEGRTPPVVATVAPGYEYMMYEGFPNVSKTGENYFVIVYNNIKGTSGSMLRTDNGSNVEERFFLNWVAYDKPADIVLNIHEIPQTTTVKPIDLTVSKQGSADNTVQLYLTWNGDNYVGTYPIEISDNYLYSSVTGTNATVTENNNSLNVSVPSSNIDYASVTVNYVKQITARLQPVNNNTFYIGNDLVKSISGTKAIVLTNIILKNAVGSVVQCNGWQIQRTDGSGKKTIEDVQGTEYTIVMETDWGCRIEFIPVLESGDLNITFVTPVGTFINGYQRIELKVTSGTTFDGGRFNDYMFVTKPAYQKFNGFYNATDENHTIIPGSTAMTADATYIADWSSEKMDLKISKEKVGDNVTINAMKDSITSLDVGTLHRVEYGSVITLSISPELGKTMDIEKTRGTLGYTKVKTYLYAVNNGVEEKYMKIWNSIYDSSSDKWVLDGVLYKHNDSTDEWVLADGTDLNLYYKSSNGSIFTYDAASGKYQSVSLGSGYFKYTMTLDGKYVDTYGNIWSVGNNGVMTKETGTVYTINSNNTVKAVYSIDYRTGVFTKISGDGPDTPSQYYYTDEFGSWFTYDTQRGSDDSARYLCYWVNPNLYNAREQYKENNVTYYMDKFGNIYEDWLGSPTELSEGRGFLWTFQLKGDLSDFKICLKDITYEIHFIVNDVLVDPNGSSKISTIGFDENETDYHGYSIPQYTEVVFNDFRYVPKTFKGIQWYTDPECTVPYSVSNTKTNTATGGHITTWTDFVNVEDDTNYNESTHVQGYKYSFVSKYTITLYAKTHAIVVNAYNYDETQHVSYEFEEVDGSITVPSTTAFELNDHIFVGWAIKDEYGKHEYVYTPGESVNTRNLGVTTLNLYAYYLSDGSSVIPYDGNSHSAVITERDLANQISLEYLMKGDSENSSSLIVRYSYYPICSTDEGTSDPEDYEYSNVATWDGDKCSNTVYYAIKILTPLGIEKIKGNQDSNPYQNSNQCYEIYGNTIVDIEPRDVYLVAPTVYKKEGEGSITVTADDVKVYGLDSLDGWTISLYTDPSNEYGTTNSEPGVIHTRAMIEPTSAENNSWRNNYIIHKLDGSLVIYSDDSSKHEFEGY